MGVLNVTPDSFSDGGKYFTHEKAMIKAQQMIEAGADMIDIGGESSKPGAATVSCEEELTRVIPIIKEIRKESDICLSIDTTKAQVMHEAVAAGASMINDISGFRSNESLALAVKLDVPLCIMHMQGNPETMQNKPFYSQNLIEELNQFFKQRIATLIAAGIKRQNLIIDPGFGFGKTVEHNMELVNRIAEFKRHDLPLMLGVSRKCSLGLILNAPVNRRLSGGLAIAVFAALQGVAIIRTHDVEETNQAFIMLQAIKEAGNNKKVRVQ
ncbi:MAG: dihydropteroate synthase [Tatlockia sp.]|nr:dihydropteroate synthase [Tatlockia sp.]